MTQVTNSTAVHREILQEIQRLRQQHDEASQPLADKSQQNPTLLAELRLLRYKNSHTQKHYGPCIDNLKSRFILLLHFYFG